MIFSGENSISQFQIPYYMKINCISILYQKNCLKLENKANNLEHIYFQYYKWKKSYPQIIYLESWAFSLLHYLLLIKGLRFNKLICQFVGSVQ